MTPETREMLDEKSERAYAIFNEMIRQLNEQGIYLMQFCGVIAVPSPTPGNYLWPSRKVRFRQRSNQG